MFIRIEISSSMSISSKDKTQSEWLSAYPIYSSDVSYFACVQENDSGTVERKTKLTFSLPDYVFQ